MCCANVRYGILALMNGNITVLRNTTSCNLEGTYVMETVCVIRTFAPMYHNTQQNPRKLSEYQHLTHLH